MFTTEKESFSSREERILNLWKEKDIFKKSVENRKGSKLFSSYDGPPFATGLPHYGHILAGTIKDVVLRYKTMQGFYLPRRFGWDCHGLPVENEIEKAKNLGGAPSIEKFGIGNFNEECRSIVFRFVEEWKKTVDRMGRWVDFDQTYKTMDPTYMESVWWVFSELWKKGLVYEGFKVMPFSAKLGTPLSNFEANLNYRDVDDPSLTVAMPLKEDENTSLLIWTTTPWTLISNLAVIANPKMRYVKVEKEGRFYILAKSRLEHYFEGAKAVEEFSGEDLAEKEYLPPFEYFSDRAGFRVLLDEFVGEEDGTGLVHAAPAFGEMDFFVCKREGIEPVCPIDQNGKFTSEIPEHEGQFVKEADKAIIKRLKEAGRVFDHGTIRHRYPFCWRSDSPLIYRAVSTWFVSVEKIKEQLITANEKIHWVPGHLQKGRFGKWLENARDWAISRNRYWGTPIPIWRAEDGECIAIGSKEELEKRTGKKIEDFHRHFIDDLTFEENGKTFSRVSEVFDCWFESGSMPYAQNHYPFENKELVEEGFPAEFIAEGLDQTRGWFYTLNVLSVALFNRPAFKNVIVNGILLAEDGNKMSKSLKNYPEPEIVFEKFGADAVRLYLLNSPATHGDDLRFCEKGVEQVVRGMLLPLWNSYFFLATYAKIYGWQPGADLEKPEAVIDRWILSKLQTLISDVQKSMDEYQLSDAVPPFLRFIDQVTNWYIRRCRPRFWADEDSSDRREAFQTLYQVLQSLVRIAAPFIPFISEAIYQGLRREKDPESVHLTDFPKMNPNMQDENLEKEMALAQTAVSLGHALRKEERMKVRQPLPKVFLISSDKQVLTALKSSENLILDELNVKEVVYSENEKEFVEIKVKPNFAELKKRAGAKMGPICKAVGSLSTEQVNTLLNGKSVEIEENFALTEKDLLIERKVKQGLVASCEGALTVALDLTLSEELKLEGLAREIVNKLNTMRREANLEVTDRIEVQIEGSDRVSQAYELHKDYICGEALVTKLEMVSNTGQEWDLNGEMAKIAIKITA
ncbi:MAG: isoleucine--tRNA ligase [Candidatus Algichlamydia australiensis]|nr:isoleucine--tRNA ligase [Chlamydiales bacterium]